MERAIRIIITTSLTVFLLSCFTQIVIQVQIVANGLRARTVALRLYSEDNKAD